MVVAGVAAGIYFGFWWAFIGGIISVVNELKSTDVSGASVAHQLRLEWRALSSRR